MTGKGTLRRTLALLLVLVFALSNMGFAEMAEEVVQYTEPSIVEEPVIEEPVEEPAGDEPVADEPEVVEPEVVEPEVVEPEADEPEGEPEVVAPEGGEPELVVPEDEEPAPEPDLFGTPEGETISAEANEPVLFAEEASAAALDAASSSTYPFEEDGWTEVDKATHETTPGHNSWEIVKVGGEDANPNYSLWISYHVYKCTTEGCKSYYVEKVGADGHTFTNAESTKLTQSFKADTTIKVLTGDVKCTVCDYQCKHSTSTLVDDETSAAGHVYKCTLCGAKTNLTDHTWKKSSDAAQHECSVCHESYDHTIADEETTFTDAAEHAKKEHKCSVCEQVLTPTIVTAPTKDKPAEQHILTCTVCGATSGEAENHTDVNPADGKCDVCGAALASFKLKAQDGVLHPGDTFVPATETMIPDGYDWVDSSPVFEIVEQADAFGHTSTYKKGDEQYTLPHPAETIEKTANFALNGEVKALHPGTATIKCTYQYVKAADKGKEGATVYSLSDTVKLTVKLPVTGKDLSFNVRSYGDNGELVAPDADNPTITLVADGIARKQFVIASVDLGNIDKNYADPADYAVIPSDFLDYIYKPEENITWKYDAAAIAGKATVKVSQRSFELTTNVAFEGDPIELNVTGTAANIDGASKTCSFKVVILPTQTKTTLANYIKIGEGVTSFTTKENPVVTFDTESVKGYTVGAAEVVKQDGTAQTDVTLSADGKLTAAKPGTYKIRVPFTDFVDKQDDKVDPTDPPVYAEKEFTVTEAPTAVKIQDTASEPKDITAPVTLYAGMTTQVQAAVTGGAELTPAWKSADDTVASVAADDGNKATITAKAAGSTTITVDVGGQTASMTVTVLAAPTIALSTEAVTLGEGETYTLTADVQNAPANAKITWTSDDSASANLAMTVAENNSKTVTLEGKKATNTVTITAKVSPNASEFKEVQATCTVTVKPAPSATEPGITITFDPALTGNKMNAGESVKVTFKYDEEKVGGHDFPAAPYVVDGTKDTETSTAAALSKNADGSYTLTAISAGTIKVAMPAWNNTTEKPVVAKSAVITISAPNDQLTLKKTITTMGLYETIYWTKDDIEQSMQAGGKANADGNVTIKGDGTYIEVTKTGDSWAIHALKKTGSSTDKKGSIEVNLDYGGTLKATEVIRDIKVVNAATGVSLAVDKTMLDATADKEAGVALKVTTTPGNAAANVLFDYDEKVVEVVEAEDGTYTLKPVAAGKTNLVAKIYNTAFDANNQDPALEYIYSDPIEIIVGSPATASGDLASITVAEKVLACGESTTLTAVFANGKIGTVKWSADKTTASFSPEEGNTTKFTATEGGVYNVTATVVGHETVKATAKITVLTGMTGIDVAPSTAFNMALNESTVIELKPGAGSYQVPDGGDTDPDKQADYTGLFHLAVTKGKATITDMANGKFLVKATKKGTLKLAATSTDGFSTEIVITVAPNALKKFTLSDEYLTIAKGESKNLTVTYKPKKNATPNLTYKVFDAYGDEAQNVLTWEGNVLKAADNATVGTYTIVFSVGYDTIPDQECEVHVTDQAATMALRVAKPVGMLVDPANSQEAAILDNMGGKTIALGKNETIEVLTVFDKGTDNITATADPEKGIKITQSADNEFTIKPTKKGDYTITFTGEKVGSQTLTLSVDKAASGMNIVPSTGKVTLGEGEVHIVKVPKDLNKGAGQWFSIDVDEAYLSVDEIETADIATTYKDVVTAGDLAANYVYAVTPAEGVTSGTHTVTFRSYSGAKKTLKVVCKPGIPAAADMEIVAPNSNAVELETGSLTMAPGETLLVRADTKGGNVELVWTVAEDGGEPVVIKKTSADSAHKFADKKVSVYKSGSDAIMIVANKKAAETTKLTVKVTADRYYPAKTAQATVQFHAKVDTEQDYFDSIVLGKDVLIAGQTTTATVKLTAAGEAIEEQIGAIKWKSKDTSIATIDGNGVITAKKAGKVKFTATTYYSSKSTATSVDLNVVSAPKKLTATLPEKMYAGETIEIPVKISEMKGKNVTITEALTDTVITTDTVQVAPASYITVDDVEPAPGDIYTKIVTLTAAGDPGDSATVTIGGFSSKIKAVTSKHPIEIVSEPDTFEILDDEIVLAPGNSKKIDVYFGEDEDAFANIKWSFVSNSNPEHITLDEATGTVKVSNKAGAGEKATIQGVYADTSMAGSMIAVCDVRTIAAPEKGNIVIKVPKTTLVKGERITAELHLLDGYDGTVTWASGSGSKLKLVETDGEIATFEAKAASGKTTIKATAKYTNKKKKTVSVTQTVTIKFAKAPAQLTLAGDEVIVPSGATYIPKVNTPSTGVRAADPEDETLYSFAIENDENGIFDEDTFDSATGAVAVKGTAQKDQIGEIGLYLYAQDNPNCTLKDTILVKVAAPANHLTLYWKGAELKNVATGDVIITDGQTMTPIAKVFDADGKEMPDYDVTWTTEDTEHISLNTATGQITALKYTDVDADGNVVPVTVTATAGSFTQKYTIVIKPKATMQKEYLLATGLKDTIGKGEAIDVTVGLDKAVADQFKDEGYTFDLKTSDKSIISIAKKASPADTWTLTGKASGKSAKITVSAKQGTKTVASWAQNVAVKAKATDLTLNESAKTIGAGESFSFTATLKDYGGTIDANTFTATATADDSGEAIVEVAKAADNFTFTVTGKKAGESTITVTNSVLPEKSATVTVTVKAAPTAITVTATPATLRAGETINLSAKLNQGEWSKGVEWTVDAVAEPEKPDAPTGSANLVKTNELTTTATAGKPGKVQFTAALVDNEEVVSAPAEVEIKAAPTKNNIDDMVDLYSVGTDTMSIGQTTKATIAFKTNEDVTIDKWVSSNPDVVVVTVDATDSTKKTATITAKAAGKATVYAVAYNGQELTSEKTPAKEITVVAAPATVELTPVPPTEMAQGLSVKVTAVAKDADGNPVDAICTLASSNGTIVEVTAVEGEKNTWTITGKAAGSAMITLTPEGIATASEKAVFKQYAIKVTAETAADMTVTVAKAADTGLTAAAKENQMRSTVEFAQATGAVTITAAVASLKAYALKENGAEKKYIGIEVKNTTSDATSFEGVKIDGKALPEDGSAVVSGDDNSTLTIWLDAENIPESIELTRSNAGKFYHKTLTFSMEADEKVPMTVDVKKMEHGNTTDTNKENTAANLAAITSVEFDKDSNVVTITGNYSALKSFTPVRESDQTQGQHLWIGVEVDTGEEDIETVKWEGKKLAAVDKQDAKDCGLGAKSVPLWLAADELYKNGPVTRTIEMDDGSKLPVVLTFKFVDDGPLSKFEVTPATAAADDLLGKDVAALQTGVAIKDDTVSGTLHYTEGYTRFSGVADEQKGYYLALHTEAATGMEVEIKVTGGQDVSHSDPKKLNAGSDTLILLVKDAKEKVEFTLTEGTKKATRTLDLSGLKFDPLRFLEDDETTGYGDVIKAQDLYSDLTYTYEDGTYKIEGNFKLIKTWDNADQKVPAGGGHYFAFRFDPSIIGKNFIYSEAAAEGDFVQKDNKTAAQQVETYWVVKIDTTKKFKFEIADHQTVILDFTKATLEIDWNEGFVLKDTSVKYSGNAYDRPISASQSGIEITEIGDKDGTEYEVTGDLHYARYPEKHPGTGALQEGQGTGYYLILDYELKLDKGFTAERKVNRADDVGDARQFTSFGVDVDQQVCWFKDEANRPTEMIVKLHKCGETKVITYDLSKLTFNPVYIPQEEDTASKYFDKTSDTFQTDMKYTVAKNEEGAYVFTVTGTSKKVNLSEITGVPEGAQELSNQYCAAISFDPACIKGKTMNMKKGPTLAEATIEENKSNNCGDDECDWLLNITENKVFKFVIDEKKSTEQTYILDFTGVECEK